MCTVVPFFITACNSSSLCDNGFCMHDNWRCDGLNQCGDWSDEKYCNGSQPIPTTPAPPTPAPHAGGGGSSGGIFSSYLISRSRITFACKLEYSFNTVLLSYEIKVIISYGYYYESQHIKIKTYSITLQHK